MKGYVLDELWRQVEDEPPPLTAEQRDRLQVLLRPLAVELTRLARERAAELERAAR